MLMSGRVAPNLALCFAPSSLWARYSPLLGPTDADGVSGTGDGPAGLTPRLSFVAMHAPAPAPAAIPAAMRSAKMPGVGPLPSFPPFAAA